MRPAAGDRHRSGAGVECPIGGGGTGFLRSIDDDLSFPAGQPAGHDHQQQPEGGDVDHGPELISRPGRKASAEKSNTPGAPHSRAGPHLWRQGPRRVLRIPDAIDEGHQEPRLERQWRCLRVPRRDAGAVTDRNMRAAGYWFAAQQLMAFLGAAMGELQTEAKAFWRSRREDRLQARAPANPSAAPSRPINPSLCVLLRHKRQSQTRWPGAQSQVNALASSSPRCTEVSARIPLADPRPALVVARRWASAAPAASLESAGPIWIGWSGWHVDLRISNHVRYASRDYPVRSLSISRSIVSSL